MADGFLGRWSRRKQDAREGKPLAQEPAAPAVPPAAAGGAARAPAAQTSAVPRAPAVPASAPAAPVAAPPAEAPPLPTLADAQALTPASDFKPFVARAVPPEVRNLALKKLFADPHFNVMDGLDIYVGDYTQPDPLPAGMLRQMASAHALGLFDAEKPQEPAEPAGPAAPPIAPEGAQPREAAGAAGATDVAQSGVCTAVPSVAPSEPEPGAAPRAAAAPASQPEHDHDASLRLQPDHAPQREGAGRGTA